MAENENAAAPAAETAGDAPAAGEAPAAAAEAPQAEAPQAEAAPQEPQAPPEEITYHAVEKDGQVTAIWEMQGRKHLRTIDPRSRQGQEILRLYTAEHGE
jgi:hypothetical protein